MSANPIKETLYSEEQFIVLTGASRSTLLRWRQQGKLGCYKMPNGRVVYGESHFLALLRQSEQNPEVVTSHLSQEEIQQIRGTAPRAIQGAGMYQSQTL